MREENIITSLPNSPNRYLSDNSYYYYIRVVLTHINTPLLRYMCLARYDLHLGCPCKQMICGTVNRFPLCTVLPDKGWMCVCVCVCLAVHVCFMCLCVSLALSACLSVYLSVSGCLSAYLSTSELS